PFPPLAPEPPTPPSFDVGPFDFDFDFAFDFDPGAFGDLHLDLNAIQEEARQAAESARFALQSVQPFTFSASTSQGAERQSDSLYEQARESIDHSRYDRAIDQLDRLVSLPNANRIDAALYWKSYALNKLEKRVEALNTLADLQRRFADSRWLRDAKAL